MRRMITLLAVVAWSAMAYVPNPIDGPQFHRTDYGNIQFLVNQNIAPGLTRADGTTVWITPDSDPLGAIQSAVATWNGVSTTAAHFAQLLTTNLSYNKDDGNNVIVFSDDLYTQALGAGILAATVVAYDPANPGPIVDSDIIFSPLIQFSTTQAPGTYDIQAILTHELGHSLGFNHTNIISATMFYATLSQDVHQRALTADDMAFVSSLYPLSSGGGYGTVSGVASVNGTPLLGGAITAIDPNTGITVGGFSSVNDGSFSFQVPAGNYFVYVEPAGNLVLYQTAQSAGQNLIFTSFQSAFAGGNDQPALIQTQAGGTSTVNLNAAAGITSMTVPYVGVGTAGVMGDVHGVLTKAAITISSGQSVDLVLSNPLSGTLKESNIQILGPATLRPGSLRRDVIVLSDGTPIYRFTLDIPPLTANAMATLVFRNGSDILTRSGTLSLTRPQSVNAASFLGGPVAPGEILSFFGSHLGPSSPLSNGGFDAKGFLPVSLGGITVSFDSTQAPLFYVSNNQINLQVPYEIAGQSYTVMNVIYNGTPVVTSTLAVAKSAPGIFVVTNADGTVNGPAAPATAGSVLVIYGTGVGATSGLIQTGAASPANSTVPASVTIAGRPVTPIFSGLTPGSVGLSQVNLAIPAGTPAGDGVPVQFTINGAATQTVSISVR